MTSIDPSNLEEYERLESMFWRTLRQTFIRVLDTGTEAVDYYRESLFKSSPYERLLALHDDPLDVAAVLAGVTLTPDIISRYEALLSETAPAEQEGKIVVWKKLAGLAMAAAILVGLALAGSIVGQITGELLIVTVIIGMFAGWLAAKIVSGTGLVLISDIVVGVLGALVAAWLFPHLGIHLGTGIIKDISGATIGAVVFLIILSLFHKRGRVG
jgi:uncharacterized membrane protein YeaQ/YmgE (transglycosylase-associated protein family)